MAQTSKRSRGRAWKNERALVSKKNATRSRSNKYRPESDSSPHPDSGGTGRYWRAGYTRKDGTKVKGHYVTKSNR